MKAGMIITMPRYDQVTEYLSQFSAEIIEEADSKGISVRRLEDSEANSESFEKAVKKLDYNFLFFNGHGSSTEIMGHKTWIIMLGKNESLLHDRITYARSCDAGRTLGFKIIQDSQRACFIGYNKPFQFYTDDNWSSTPLKDNKARLFLEPSNIIPISILKGNSAIVACDKSKKAFMKNIHKLLKERTEGAYLLAGALWNNYTAQVILGNNKARMI